MSTQESTYRYTLVAALVVGMAVILLMLGWAIRGFQIFW
jgi:hypothetical protein